MAITLKLVILWIVILLITFYLLNKKKYTELICAASFFLLFFPVDAVGLISGKSYNSAGSMNISIVGYFTIICFLVLILLRHGKFKCNNKYLLGVFGSLAVMFFLRIVFDGPSALSNKMLDNYLLPALLGTIIVVEREKIDLNKVLKFIYICIVLNALIAVFEYFYGSSLFFHNYYLDTLPWYNNIYNSTQYGIKFRSTALLGHPLTGGLYYCVALVYGLYTYKDENRLWSIGKLILISCAIITTNARSVMLFAIIYVFYFFLRDKRYGKLFVLLVGIVMFFLLNDVSSIYNSLFARDVLGSSYMVRINALMKFSSIPLSSLITGTGYNKAGTLLAALGFTTNFEISYLIILIENGIIGFTFWLVYILTGCNFKNITPNTRTNKMRKGFLFAYFFVGMLSNSFGDPGSLNYLLWIFLGATHLVDPVLTVRE